MTYNEWKSKISESIVDVEFYWPESNNFEKLTKSFLRKNDSVYKCKTLGAVNEEEVEDFIENSDNIGIYYIKKTDHFDYKFYIRLIDFNNDELSPVTVEDYFLANEEELTNASTTVDEIREKVDKVEGLDLIFIKKMKKKRTPDIDTMHIFIVSELTDGNMIYV